MRASLDVQFFVPFRELQSLRSFRNLLVSTHQPPPRSLDDIERVIDLNLRKGTLAAFSTFFNASVRIFSSSVSSVPRAWMDASSAKFWPKLLHGCRRVCRQTRSSTGPPGISVWCWWLTMIPRLTTLLVNSWPLDGLWARLPDDLAR